MTISIGRFEGGEIRNVSRSGDKVTIDGQYQGDSVGETQIRMQQIQGLSDNDDEEVFPVVAPSRPDLDGFWRVTDVKISELPGGTTGKKFIWRWSVTMWRVGGGYANPMFEMVALSTVRTNAVGVTDTEPTGTIGVRPGDLTQYGDLAESPYLREGEDGPVVVYTAKAPMALTATATTWPPSRFYEHSTKIEILSDGTWWPIVGDQLGALGSPGAWRISNGLVRFTPSATNVGDLKIEVFNATSSAWQAMEAELRLGHESTGFQQDASAGGFVTGYNSGTSTVEYVQPTIVRNDRDCVVVKVDRSGNQSQTFTLWSGDMFMRMYYQAAANLVYAIQARSAWWATEISLVAPFSYNPGIVADSADANGHKMAVLYTDDNSWSVYSGGIEGLYAGAAGTVVSFGFGVLKTGESATALAEQYVAARSVQTQVVSR